MSEEIALSRNGVPIRRPDERWRHIIEEHAELDGMRENVVDAISNAERVLSGTGGELFAVRMTESGKALVVIYREIDAKDGFAITAFETRRFRSLDRRVQIWPQQT